jgi:hypothetical protein
MMPTVKSSTIVRPKVAISTDPVRQSRSKSRNSFFSAMFQATTTKRPASAESGMKLAKGAATSTNVAFDVDGMTVAKANTKVEDTVIKTIVIGDAYLEKGKKDTRRTFLCLIGEKGKVLLTFFTDK